KAGTHTLCPLVLGAQSEAFRLTERRWLWVPAFAGTTREDSIVKQSNRHCEPTGRANARRMTGSAKQSIEPQRKMDCFVATLLAMTVSPFVLARRPCEDRKSYVEAPSFGRGGRSLLPQLT